ncbi:MAG: ATP-binding protein [Paracoccaceae bacterium]|nr:ATP-binding protein [Paracoccaceae bacterium]
MPHEDLVDEARKPLMSRDFAGTPEGVREALGAMRRGLDGLEAGSEEAFSAELVVAEALNNVVEHALAGVGEPRFRLGLSHGGRGIYVEICDGGRPMPDGKPPLGAAPVVPAETEALPEGGFGWFLIRELARELTYERCGGENRLTFRLAICQGEVA